jgi:signal transduction histidine kinase
MARDIGGNNARLSALFVAAILIPGCVLAYFSIQNVGSQKELAEKRLQEEEEGLAAALGTFLRDELAKAAAVFFTVTDGANPDLRTSALPAETRSYVARAFALDAAGGFLWPRYVEARAADEAAPESTRALALLSGAETAEFRSKNLDEAARLYRDAASAARRQATRAAATNGVARVLVKGGRTEQAVSQYELLLERYGSVRDQDDVAFARYALHQLTRIRADDPGAVARPLSVLLSRVESGEEPLTDQTEPLLQDVEDWLKQNPGVAAPNELIPQVISTLRSRLDFVTHDAKSIEFFRSGNPASFPTLDLGSSGAVAGEVGGRPRLYIVQRIAHRLGVVGFEVNLERLRAVLLERAARTPTRLDMDVDIVPRADGQYANGAAGVLRDLSPLVPAWRVSIRPRDPGIVSRYVVQQRWIYGTMLTLLVAGMVLGVVLVGRDLSRERRLAQLRTDFVANVTHELKTPLTSIRMFAETLQQGRTSNEAERQESLDVIVGETQRLTRLINTVLDFSKIERGQKQYRMADVEVSEVVRSALNTLKYSLAEKGFTLEAEIEPRVRATGDADALEQAVLNLVDNAVKYSRHTRWVRIGLWSEDQLVFLRVSDKGIGIPEGEKRRIFEKFYRSRTGTDGDVGGAGLGLTVVQHIVSAHGGRIEVESKVGEGSSFTIVLPASRDRGPGIRGQLLAATNGATAEDPPRDSRSPALDRRSSASDPRSLIPDP